MTLYGLYHEHHGHLIGWQRTFCCGRPARSIHARSTGHCRACILDRSEKIEARAAALALDLDKRRAAAQLALPLGRLTVPVGHAQAVV